MTITSQELERRNAPGRAKLQAAIASSNAVLMVGAGCSVELGYPSLPELIRLMASTLIPNITIPDLPDDKHRAFFIKCQCQGANNGNLEPYWRFLRERFCPRAPTHTNFHCDLVSLRFAGFVTTNYDTVIESAISETFRRQRPPCEPINLCDEKAHYRVLEFLRELGNSNSDRYRVLHLHGHYNQPEDIILAQDEYERFYTRRILKDDGKLEPSDAHPETSLHHKVIWSLLATRTVVFVGFSLEDEFFNDVLSVWRRDFKLINECPHVAVMGFNRTEDLSFKEASLKRSGVTPIYYEVMGADATDYSGLKMLVAELAEPFRTRTVPPTVNELSKRTLELL